MMRYLLSCCLFLIALNGAHASDAPLIAVIIDDLGYHKSPDDEVATMPLPVTCAILPNTPYSKQLAKSSLENGKEVILHLPMQSTEGNPLGPGGLEMDMSERLFKMSLSGSLESLPGVSGVNNHMGSLLTQHPGHMSWLMHELKDRPDLYFIDSRTTANTVALKIAREYNIPSLRRDIFLDSIPDDEAYASEQLDKALKIAEKKGYAIVIGHPYPATLNTLKTRAPELKAAGYQFVTVSELITELNRRQPQWLAYLSPSLRDAKNLKQ
jgi:polysaccharide deacetylase 2 family uncharacterized protein YibQ